MITDTKEAARKGLRQRIFAWAHSQGESPAYDRTVTPYKQALFADLSGTVLEIGAGTGENFNYYPAGIHWIGIEPNVYMHPRLLKTAKSTGSRANSAAESPSRSPWRMPASDVVVSTLVLCSVSDQARVLSEIRRVLRPGGRFLFLEHVAAPAGSAHAADAEDLIKPFWRLAADGCNPDRETAAADRTRRIQPRRNSAFRRAVALASPHIAGTAIK